MQRKNILTNRRVGVVIHCGILWHERRATIETPAVPEPVIKKSLVLSLSAEDHCRHRFVDRPAEESLVGRWDYRDHQALLRVM
jgi:hypothetical protein